MTSQPPPAPLSPPHLTLYTRPGCCLCDEAHATLAPLLAALHIPLEVINIDLNPTLRQRFGYTIPVVEHGARVLATLRIDPDRLRAYLTDPTAA